jgi:hypothetical protein
VTLLAAAPATAGRAMRPARARTSAIRDKRVSLGLGGRTRIDRNADGVEHEPHAGRLALLVAL